MERLDFLFYLSSILRTNNVRSNSIMIEKTSDDLRTTYSMANIKQLLTEQIARSDRFDDLELTFVVKSIYG